MFRLHVATALLLAAGPAAAQQLTSQLVVSSTDQAPGHAAGLTYRVFFAPAINANGQLAIAGFPATSGSNSAIWVGAPGNIQLVAKTGDAVPGAAGLTFSSTYFNYGINDNGQVAFFAELTGASFPNNRAVVVGTPSGLQVLARPPGAAAGQPGGVTYQQLFSVDSVSNAGVMYGAVLAGTPNTSATFVGGGTQPHQAVLQINQALPGISGATLNFPQVINYTNSGKFALHASTFAAGGGAGPTGIWLGPPSDLALAARTGGAAPGVTGATFSTLNVPWASQDGSKLAFTGVMNGVPSSTTSGLWVGAPGSLQLAAREGSQAAGFGTGVRYDTIVAGTQMRFSDVGVALDGFVTGTGISSTNNEAVWISTGAAMQLVAREGQQLPGGPAGVLLGSFNTGNNMSMNRNGLLAMEATLTGTGVTGSNNDVLLVARPDGTLEVVARSGDVMDLGSLGLKTISGVVLSPGGMGDGNLLAWKADFTDGTSAIFVTPVPEPGLVLVVAAGFLAWRRARANPPVA